MAGVQGGWLIAGSIVGFMYNHIGLGGVLLIDVSTYVVSFLCYFAVRKGRHVVPPPEELRADILAAEIAGSASGARCARDLHFLARSSRGRLLGISWALFLGAMMTGVVVTPSLSDRVFHAGAKSATAGSMPDGAPAHSSARCMRRSDCRLGGRRAIAFSMALLSVCMVCAPVSPVSVSRHLLVYFVMGSARGVGGVAMNTSLMEMVPKHLMGRVQNTFYFAGTFPATRPRPQRRRRRTQSQPGGRIRDPGRVYGLSFVAASWPVATAAAIEEVSVIK
jgi:hypothetical protein